MDELLKAVIGSLDFLLEREAKSGPGDAAAKAADLRDELQSAWLGAREDLKDHEHARESDPTPAGETVTAPAEPAPA